MNLNDVLDGLSEQQKQKLVEAKTKDELAGLAGLDAAQLSDGQLSGVSGGVIGGCFNPFYCGCSCGWTGTACSGSPCPSCGARTYVIDEPMGLCPGCQSMVPLTAAGGPCPICGQHLPLTLQAVFTPFNGRVI